MVQLLAHRIQRHEADEDYSHQNEERQHLSSADPCTLPGSGPVVFLFESEALAQGGTQHEGANDCQLAQSLESLINDIAAEKPWIVCKLHGVTSAQAEHLLGPFICAVRS